jgi:hypothetical protein
MLDDTPATPEPPHRRAQLGAQRLGNRYGPPLTEYSCWRPFFSLLQGVPRYGGIHLGLDPPILALAPAAKPHPTSVGYGLPPLVGGCAVPRFGTVHQSSSNTRS